MQVTVKVTNQLQLQLYFGLQKLQVNYSKVTVTVFEKVTVTVSVRDDKVTYASFQAGRRPARKLVTLILGTTYLLDNILQQ